MNRRQAVLALGLVLGALAVALAVLWPQSPEERMRETAGMLAQTVSFAEPQANPVLWGAQLNERWQELLAPEVEVTLPEVSQGLPHGRRELAFAAAHILSRYSSLQVSLGALEVRVSPEPRASGTVTVTADQGGELRRDERPIQLGFIEIDGEMRVNRVEIGAAP